MRAIYLMVLGMLVSSVGLIAQSDSIAEVSFTYDAAGNRTQREVIYYEGGTKSARVNHDVEEEEIEFDKGLNVYPNPASHSLYVTVNDEVLEADQKMLLLFDNLGKLVYQSTTLQELNQVDVSNLPEATYILKLIYGNRHKEWIIIKN